MLTSFSKLIVFGLLSKLGEKVVDQSYQYVSNKVREKTRAQITLAPAVYDLIAPWLFSLCESNLVRYDLNDKYERRRKNGSLTKAFSEGYYTAYIDGVKCNILVQNYNEKDADALTADIYIPLNQLDKIERIIEEKTKEASLRLNGGLPVYDYNGIWLFSLLREKRLKSSLHYKGDNPLDTIFNKIEEWKTSPKVQGSNNNFGILLKGKPGSGKTTIASVIASELNMPLFIGDGTYLKSSLNTISPNVVLLLDECDSYLSKRNNENKKEVSNILSLLDGPLTPPGLIIVYTTNHFDDLDPALLRPGRVDLIIDMDQYYETPGVDILENLETKD